MAEEPFASIAADDVSSLSLHLGASPLPPSSLSLPPTHPSLSNLFPPGKPRRHLCLLHLAAAAGSPGCLALILSLSPRAWVDQRAGDGRTPLLIASLHSHAHNSCACLRALLKAGAKPDVVRKGDGWSAAHCAAHAGCPSCLRLLLQKAPHLAHAPAHGGFTPLHAAASCSSSLPLCPMPSPASFHSPPPSNSPDTPASSPYPLSFPVAPSRPRSHSHTRGARECVSELLCGGASLESCLSDGSRPLHLACRLGHARIAALLLERRARGDARAGGGESPLHAAATAGHSGIVRMLLARAPPAQLGGAASALRFILLESRRGVECRARVSSCLISAGVALASEDLDRLLSTAGGCMLDPSQGNPLGQLWMELELSQARLTRLPTLLMLSERAAANALDATNVLASLQAASLIGARRLQLECERLIVQNFGELRRAGVFACLTPRLVLERLLCNMLSRGRRSSLHSTSRGDHGSPELNGEGGVPPPVDKTPNVCELDVFDHSSCQHACEGAGGLIEDGAHYSDEMDGSSVSGESDEEDDHRWWTRC